MDVKLAVIYYSATGTTYQLARDIEAAAKTAGSEVHLRKVHESVPDDVIEGNAAWAAHRRETQDVAEASIVFGLTHPPWPSECPAQTVY